MAFSKSGVSKVAWPMRLGLIMALSPIRYPALRPRPKTMHDYSSIRSGALSAAKPWNHRGLTRGDGFSPRSTHPTLRLTTTYTLDKIEIFGESLREQHRTHGSKRTRPATSLRPPKPPLPPPPAPRSPPTPSPPPT